MYQVWHGSLHIPPPPPSPPLPVRALSPPPNKRKGLMARSKSYQLITSSPSFQTTSSTESSISSIKPPTLLPSLPLTTSPRVSEVSLRTSRTPRPPSWHRLTFGSIPPPPIPPRCPPSSSRKKGNQPTQARRSPHRRRGEPVSSFSCPPESESITPSRPYSELPDEKMKKASKEDRSMSTATLQPKDGVRGRTSRKPVGTSAHLEGRKKKTDQNMDKRPPSRRAHERFLSKADPHPRPDPIKGYIVVSTHPTHYEIIVRLEGISLYSVMLFTRRKRMLHIAADNYADGGLTAHSSGWERRIGFGRDADLTAIRAEFDGRFLKVVVPRKDEIEA